MSTNTNKSPYEIRLDLLNLAQKICYDREVAKSAQEVLDDNDREDFIINHAPSTEDIIAEAEKLNSFISKTPR